MAKFALNDRNFALVAVRWLLGIQALASGLNWWIKILPFPNMYEAMDGPVKHQILLTLVESGWMFTTAKALEVILGICLLLNRHAVLALVLSFPIMLMTFLLDLFPFMGNIMPFLAGDVSGPAMWASFLDMLFFGAGVFVMQAYLMAEYFDDYRQMFTVTPGGDPAAWSNALDANWIKTGLRWLSYTVGAFSTIWAIGMILGVIEWSSLAMLAPPR